MTQTLLAHFDGKVIVPDEPVKLPVGKALRIEVAVAKKARPRSQKRPRKIIGQGQFHSGIADLGSNKKHLKGFGK
jgi:hypothetical protein